jgi:hydroxymethylpyrimidine pyrophosphatase-like HAD family hydrolase
MKEKIVMIDQDGTIFDRNYQTNSDIGDIVAVALDKGILLVPNSDTPILRLVKNFKSALGFEPTTIIGECGAVACRDGEEFKLCLSGEPGEFIDELIITFENCDCDIKIGDSATWIRENKIFQANRRLLIIDGFRKSSIGFYLRKADSSGIACLDEEWFSYGKKVVESIALPDGFSVFDFNPKYGIAIAGPSGVSKTNGSAFLHYNFPEADIFMIGDSEADVINDNRVVVCSVGNGSDILKSKSKFVANQLYTAGLGECLNWIMSLV